MTAIAQLRKDAWLLILAVLLAAGPLALRLDRGVLIWWIAVAAAAGWLLWVLRADLLVGLLGWFAVLGCLHEEFWRFRAAGWPALTVPRLWLAVLLVSFVLALLFGRLRWRGHATVLVPAVLLLAYLSASAAISGFETSAVATVHYRLIGGWWMPVVAMLVASSCLRSERQLLRWLTFFCLFGAYLTFTGWCERFGFWSLVWPDFIADPSRGIHWGRVRGPFLVSAVAGVVLVYCFFNNLVLVRFVSAPMRWPILLLNLLSLPVIFWTYTRAVWLAMLVGLAIWIFWSRRGWTRIAFTCAAASLAIVLAVGLWPRLTSPQREVGGWTDKTPIYVRLGLAKITYQMFLDRPLFGVGFGHFQDRAADYATDPAGPDYAFAATAMQHNNFLSLLSEAGLVGLGLYLWLLWRMARSAGRLWRRIPPEAPSPVGREWLVLFWIAFAVYLIDGFFRETSVYPFTNSLFFALAGLVISLDQLLGPEGQASESPAE